MGLGDSAGRSRHNPTAMEARRRATPREKAKIDPPQDLLHHVHIGAVEVRFSTMKAAFAIGTLFVLIGLLVFEPLSWFGAVIQILAAINLEQPGRHRLDHSRRIGRR